MLRQLLTCSGRSLAGLLLALVATLAGCAEMPVSSARFQSLDSGAYTLASGDKLRVLVFGQDNLSNIYTVDGSGKIAMPLIGSVPAAGFTTTALASNVAGRLRDGYVREPNVTIEVEQYRPFFVLGEVAQSGQFPYVNGMTAQTAVAIAGGFSPRARRDAVRITRMKDGRTYQGLVPVESPVRPGDTITVEERWF